MVRRIQGWDPVLIISQVRSGKYVLLLKGSRSDTSSSTFHVDHLFADVALSISQSCHTASSHGIHELQGIDICRWTIQQRLRAGLERDSKQNNSKDVAATPSR